MRATIIIDKYVCMCISSMIITSHADNYYD